MSRMVRLGHRAFDTFTQALQEERGRVAVALVVPLLVITIAILVAYLEVRVPQVHADNVTTSLTVLNTPPNWTVDAQESTQSSTSTPTNAGTTLSFVATATDSSSDPYWLIICSAPGVTPHDSAQPTCSGGIQWAISAQTTSAQQATASTTTIPTAPFNNESNAWYAYICDGNSSGAACNAQVDQGSGNTVSPFVINHPPVFSAISNDAPKNPGAVLTWTATSYDNDTIRGGDTVKLFVCKAADFIAGSSSCGAGGTWAASTFSASNPATSTTLAIPMQDTSYNAYVYIMDQNQLVATSTFQASNSSFTVSNVAPSVAAASIALLNTDGSSTPMQLTVPGGQTTGFKVNFTVTDNNGCQNASAGNEISLASTTIYRSGVTQASCNVGSQFNANRCYPSANGQTQISCSQTSCVPGSANATWQCTFGLWYNADPTDAGSQYSAQNWLSSVQAVDDNGLMSSLTESSTGNAVNSFVAFSVPQSSIFYGGLQPNQSLPVSTTTSMTSLGNVGLDQNLYGSTMCTTWSPLDPDSCDAGGPDATRKIPVANQKIATSSVAYASASAYVLTASTSPYALGIHIPKTIATSSSASASTYWGIFVPSAITVAGSYTGQNTILASRSNASFW